MVNMNFPKRYALENSCVGTLSMLIARFSLMDTEIFMEDTQTLLNAFDTAGDFA